jgi:hypothetical protein
MLKGIQTNLYKCFLPQAWMWGIGVSAFLHPEGVYDDPKGWEFRQNIYLRLRAHFRFENEFNLFAEVGHRSAFSINIYGYPVENISFLNIANLYTPETIDQCFSHDGNGSIPGLKNNKGKWDSTGHSKRLIYISKETLRLFSNLYDATDTPADASRLPALHIEAFIGVLKKFTDKPKRLEDLKDEYIASEMWQETGAQKDGTIRRETRFPDHPAEWVLSGPHFFVGNPFNKTPFSVCKLKSDYSPLDLTVLPEKYLPRSNYVPACDTEEYEKRTPKVPWEEKRPVTDFFRIVFRRRLNLMQERTLIPSIIPPGSSHIHPVLSLTFRHSSNLLSYLSAASCIVYDFFVKSMGKVDLYESTLNKTPIPDHSPSLIVRILSTGWI